MTSVLIPGGDVESLDEPVGDDERAAAATWRSFRHNPMGLAATVILALLVVVAVCAPLIADYPDGFSSDVLAPPSGAHWFGTDNLGRDLFAEVVWGTRVSLTVGFCASFLAIAIGVAVGLLGAYVPRIDTVLRMIVDLSLSLPVLPLMILVAALAGPSLGTIILVISFFSWPEVARVVRSQALSVVNLPYMDAARVLGGRHGWIVRRHLLPAVAPVITVTVVLTASRAVLSEAGLSFLGLGDPSSWSWGRILYESQQSGSMTSAWWTTFFPSVAILLLVVAATLIAIAYNDARNLRGRDS
ncbi:ABC transporter permease [Terrabacter sp. NPDC080008]|uniref:ABC transporter permease n=1 Tax=Terrabacter sp. NPDC080008 TaxID=3155176 RepID=UPI00344C7860